MPLATSAPVDAATTNLTVTGAVLVAAVAHAAWNAILKGVKDQVVGITLIDLVCTACGALGAVLLPLPAQGSWGFLMASAVLHVGYKTFLLNAYRVGDLSQVYPVARGVSPLVVTVVAALVVEEVPTAPGLAGIALINAGLFALLGNVRGQQDRRPVAYAVGTGLFIASYTVSDGLGVRQADTVLGYIAWLFLLQGLAIPAYLFARRGGQAVAELRENLVPGVVGGLLSLGAYGLVIWAQTRGALAAVAALRETSVIVAAVIGAVMFREPFGRRRTAAAVLVTLGVILLVST
ncbi:MAG: EamA family transporter [Carbonactinosporaceae bacterium]